MGGQYGDFYGASMFDFQAMRAGYLVAQGIDEDQAPDQIDSPEDLDNLYAALADHMKEEPDKWQ